MSRSAGTLVTTYNATYSAPSMLPGYGGHVPTTNFQYGETYGHATQKYFNDYRSEVLNSSKSLYSRGGYFPTSNSNNPDLAISNRRISRDKRLFRANYELNNYHFDRTKELSDFYDRTQQHRYQYSDRTGELHPVKHFKLPLSNDKMNESFLPYTSMMLRHKSEINIPFSKNFMRPKGVKTFDEYKLFN
ncbi:hypothetical protein BpHYR1_001648 [Brachionus plicatilis]|uniref:Ciliary microtubule inner protein 2C n=1 Tax=Brachionus plicatilis TaxID=10195 RepID=A0A3M7SXI4_BRAPC|nr:hypothetical protein BpHYR1_001648 [Brachionus plicatilis]